MSQTSGENRDFAPNAPWIHLFTGMSMIVNGLFQAYLSTQYVFFVSLYIGENFHPVLYPNNNCSTWKPRPPRFQNLQQQLQMEVGAEKNMFFFSARDGSFLKIVRGFVGFIGSTFWPIVFGRILENAKNVINADNGGWNHSFSWH